MAKKWTMDEFPPLDLFAVGRERVVNDFRHDKYAEKEWRNRCLELSKKIEAPRLKPTPGLQEGSQAAAAAIKEEEKWEAATVALRHVFFNRSRGYGTTDMEIESVIFRPLTGSVQIMNGLRRWFAVVWYRPDSEIQAGTQPPRWYIGKNFGSPSVIPAVKLWRNPKLERIDPLFAKMHKKSAPHGIYVPLPPEAWSPVQLVVPKPQIIHAWAEYAGDITKDYTSKVGLKGSQEFAQMKADAKAAGKRVCIMHIDVFGIRHRTFVSP